MGASEQIHNMRHHSTSISMKNNTTRKEKITLQMIQTVKYINVLQQRNLCPGVLLFNKSPEIVTFVLSLSTLKNDISCLSWQEPLLRVLLLFMEFDGLQEPIYLSSAAVRCFPASLLKSMCITCRLSVTVPLCHTMLPCSLSSQPRCALLLYAQMCSRTQ